MFPPAQFLSFPLYKPFLFPSPPLCLSVCLSVLPSHSSLTRTPAHLSPLLPLLPIFRLFVSPTQPGSRLLSPILRGGGGKEFAADRCIARRQTHGRPCAGQFLPECPKSHIPSIISGTGKTDGRINEHSLIKRRKGCLPLLPLTRAETHIQHGHRSPAPVPVQFCSRTGPLNKAQGSTPAPDREERGRRG